MKVNEFCHAYNITTKELLTELKAKFPGQKFTSNTELPPGFQRTIQEQVEEYIQVMNISLPETSGEIAQVPEVKEAYLYALLETLNRTRLEDFKLEGQIAAVEDVQAYQASYNQVWALFQQGELATQQTRNQKLSERLNAIATQKEDADKQMGKNAVIETCVNYGKQQLKNRLTELMG